MSISHQNGTIPRYSIFSVIPGLTPTLIFFAAWLLLMGFINAVAMFPGVRCRYSTEPRNNTGQRRWRGHGAEQGNYFDGNLIIVNSLLTELGQEDGERD